MNARGKISLAGFSYHVGATYAGEPVEVVASGGLVDILHAGVVVATHAQRLREDQADRLPAGPGDPPGPGRHRRADGDRLVHGDMTGKVQRLPTRLPLDCDTPPVRHQERRARTTAGRDLAYALRTCPKPPGWALAAWSVSGRGGRWQLFPDAHTGRKSSARPRQSASPRWR